jgi:hypothetical protein
MPRGSKVQSNIFHLYVTTVHHEINKETSSREEDGSDEERMARAESFVIMLMV